jgi:hypothetical protein
VLDTSDLKFFSVHSSKSSWNCSHNSLSMRLSVFHSLIFVSVHFFQSWISVSIHSGCGAILQGFSGLRGSGGALWLRSSFARVQGLAVVEGLLWLRSGFARVVACGSVCRVDLPWLRGGTNLVGWDSKEEIAESNSLSGCWQQK